MLFVLCILRKQICQSESLAYIAVNCIVSLLAQRAVPPRLN